MFGHKIWFAKLIGWNMLPNRRLLRKLYYVAAAASAR